jgi:hypothetical protein
MVKNRFLKIAVVTGLFLGFFSCDTNEDDVMQAYVTGTVFPVINEVSSSFSISKMHMSILLSLQISLLRNQLRLRKPIRERKLKLAPLLPFRSLSMSQPKKQ